MNTACKGIPISSLTAAILVVVLSACASDPPPVDSVSSVTNAVNAPGSSDAYEVVDCLLPGQIRQLGTQVTYVTERRPVRTTKEDCTIRGGEYVAGDRADYGASLKIWLSEAQKGFAEAQYYAATLYERGPDGNPDYQQAADWYRKAADQGDKRAAVSLGRLYEQGLGVSKDPTQAFKWFAKASGLNEGELSLLANKQVPNAQATKRIRELEQALAAKGQEIKKLSGELQEVNKEVATLQTTVKEQTGQAQQESAKLKQNEQQYQALQADLAALRTQPDKSQLTAALARQIQTLQAEITLETHQVTNRNAEIAQLQARIAALEKNADRIQALEQTVTSRDTEAQTLRELVAAANQDLKRLDGQLQERQRLAADERRKSQEADQRYQTAQAQLEQLRAKPDQSAVVAKYEVMVKKFQEEMGQASRELEDRNKDVVQLQQKIGSLEANAEKQAKQLQVVSVSDLGFDGPSLEIIDPPLARTRGIQVTMNELAIPVSTGARRFVTGRVLAPAGLRALTVNGEKIGRAHV